MKSSIKQISRRKQHRLTACARFLILHLAQIFRAILKLRQVVQEHQIDFPHRAVTLFGQQQLSQPAQILAAIVIFAILGKTTDWLIEIAAAPLLRWQDAFGRQSGAV